MAEEIEKLNERKSQLQKYNLHLEEENCRLKSEIEKLKFNAKVPEMYERKFWFCRNYSSEIAYYFDVFISDLIRVTRIIREKTPKLRLAVDTREKLVE